MSFYNRAGCVTIPGEMSEPHLVLASQSPRRRELLQLLGLRFEVTVADVAEIPRPNETPAELVTRLSRAKAEAVALAGDSRRPVARATLPVEPANQRSDRPATAPAAGMASNKPRLVIACDTVVALEEARRDGPPETRILGKPRDSAEAKAMLNLLRGRSHLVYSAVTVMDRTRRVATELAATRLTMRSYAESEVAAYVASGDPLDKAGAYAIQHEGFHPVENIQGCYASVMGLPLCHLARCLHRLEDELTSELPARCQAHVGHRCAAYEEILVCC